MKEVGRKGCNTSETVPVEEENTHQEEVDNAAKQDNAPKEIETVDVEILVQPVAVQNNNVPKESVEEGESKTETGTEGIDAHKGMDTLLLLQKETERGRNQILR